MGSAYRNKAGRVVVEISPHARTDDRDELVAASVHLIACEAAKGTLRTRRAVAETLYKFADDITVSGGALALDSELWTPPSLQTAPVEDTAPARPSLGQIIRKSVADNILLAAFLPFMFGWVLRGYFGSVA